MTADADPVVLVTGAGSGIGAATALAFADDGWTVYATDIETPLPDRVSERCRTRALDVTSDEQCQAVVDGILAEAGRLDCLVNNAGYAASGPLEDVAVEAGRDVFDVLVHGPHRLSRAVLPEMRDGGGRIVNVSSVLARRACPGLGAYSGGKAALSSMSDALRMELADTPVHVALVEPAWVETAFADSARSGLPDDRTPDYDGVYESLEDGWTLDGGPLAAAPETVAAAVLDAATDENPSARYPVGRFAKFVRWTEWLPQRVVDPIARRFGRVTARLDRWL
ncbi:SDR family oxidoreductase [Haloarcula laminariae]|uniref:SDR family oxidoreductase n=1 Tax=Haloarcula laminariae TaxID=2961577 RepID=UPI002405BFEC|nr:SDR family oxidoreductase [Halomicroarcula sp. FL173]